LKAITEYNYVFCLHGHLATERRRHGIIATCKEGE